MKVIRLVDGKKSENGYTLANGYGECASLKTADLVFTKIKDLRRAAGFTQKEFADYFDLPLRTLQGWESEGRSSPPDYLLKLFEYKLRNENLLTGEVEENQI